MIDHRVGTFVTTPGLELYYQSWHPLDSSQAVVIFIHGLGSHSGWFSRIAQDLVARQHTVYAFDLRGHGRSPGQRGHITSWNEFRQDLAAFVAKVKTDTSSPCFLFGHSLGAIVALDYALHRNNDLAGIILTGPPLGRVTVPPVKLAIGQLVSRLWLRFSLDTGLDITASTRNAAVVEAYMQDPWRHRRGSARLVTEFFKTVNWIHAHAHELQVPLLILHGSADLIATPEGGQLFYERVTFPHKQRIEYPGAYHDLHLDLNYPEVVADIETWLQQHLQAAVA